MALTVCTSSTSDVLGDLVAFKEYLGTISTTEDDLLESTLKRATAVVESFVRYPLRLQTYLETVPAFGTRTVMLSRTPIQAVLRVFSGTDTGEATEYTSTEVRIEDADAGLLSMVNNDEFQWTAGQGIGSAGRSFVVPGSETRPWLVEYSAGYRAAGCTSTDYGTTSTVADAPYDLLLAVMEEAKTRRYSVVRDSSVTIRKVGDLQVTYASESQQLASAVLAPTARNLAAPWRRL